MARRQRVKVVPAPRAPRLTLQATPLPQHAVNPRRSFWSWYGRQIRRHPGRTLAASVGSILVVVGLAAGSYWYANIYGQVKPWQDEPAAGIGAKPPLAGYADIPEDIYGGASIEAIRDRTVKALRFTGAANEGAELDGQRTQRAELTPAMDRLVLGQEVWVGMDLKTNADMGTAPDFQQVMQLRTDAEGSPSLALSVNAGDAGLDIRRFNGPSTGDVAKSALGPAPTDNYSRIVIGMKLTRSPSSSWVEVWRDGDPRQLRTNWDAFNQAGNQDAGGLLYSNASSAYLKFGLFRSTQPWDAEIHLRDIRVGPARSAVE